MSIGTSYRKARQFVYKFSRNQRTLRNLRNRYAGQRGFVIGNGPSLNAIDIGRLNDEVTIASNGIFLLFESTGFRPKFFTVEDRLVAEDRSDEINKIEGIQKIIPADLAQHIHRGPETTYINFLRKYPGFPKFSFHFEYEVFWGGTVSFLNIQLAAHLGLSPIYLVGFDHNYSPPAEADEQEGNVILSQSDDQNHFDPNYFGRGYRWHDPKVDRMEQGYEFAKSVLKERGVEVFNATPGGKLEVFPRVSFETLF